MHKTEILWGDFFPPLLRNQKEKIDRTVFGDGLTAVYLKTNREAVCSQEKAGSHLLGCVIKNIFLFIVKLHYQNI